MKSTETVNICIIYFNAIEPKLGVHISLNFFLNDADSVINSFKYQRNKFSGKVPQRAIDSGIVSESLNTSINKLVQKILHFQNDAFSERIY